MTAVNGSIRTGGPCGTFAHVDVDLAATVLIELRRALWRAITRQERSMLAIVEGRIMNLERRAESDKEMQDLNVISRQCGREKKQNTRINPI